MKEYYVEIKLIVESFFRNERELNFSVNFWGFFCNFIFVVGYFLIIIIMVMVLIVCLFLVCSIL